jgi:hypothetical protein
MHRALSSQGRKLTGREMCHGLPAFQILPRKKQVLKQMVLLRTEFMSKSVGECKPKGSLTNSADCEEKQLGLAM